MLTLDDLNRMDRGAFALALGGILEHSPWVAERAWERKPFESVDELHRAMMDVVRGADREDKLRLLRAHADLAGKAARAGAMTDFSKAEQGSAGLDRLADDEYARFERLNTAYRDRFGFPFIVCVRNHTKQSILEAFEGRLVNTAEAEIDAALAEVAEISRHRLTAWAA